MERSFISKKQLIVASVFAVIVAGVIFIAHNWPVSKLVVCDVGQGDGIYIHLKQGVDILIDTGPDESILECLGREMAFMDHTIDFVFISHAHFDHYGGFGAVLKRYEVAHLYVVPVYTGAKTYVRFINEARKVTKVHYIHGQEDIPVSPDVTFHIIWPDAQWLTREYTDGQNLQKTSKDMNTFSTVIYTTIEKTGILLTGDTPFDLLLHATASIPKPVPILKTSHHGSRTGLNERLLNSLKPSFVLISSGKNNRYGHPHAEVLTLLKSFDIPFMVTAQDGGIRIDFRGGRWYRRPSF